MSAKQLYKLIHKNKGQNSLICEESGGEFLFHIKVEVTEENKDIFTELRDSNLFSCDGNIVVGSPLEIEISSSKHSRGNNVYFSARHALSSYYVNPTAIDSNEFYIADINYDSLGEESVKPKEVTSVLNIISVGKVLTLLSNYNKNKDLIFVNQSTMTVNIQFDYNELTKEFIEHTSTVGFQRTLDEIKDWIDIDAEKQHLQQKKTVFSSQLFNLLNATTLGIDNYLVTLLNFEKLVKNSVSSYQLYMEDFSFSRFEKKIEERSLDFYEKINKAVLSIRNQVLALPVAFIFINTIRSNLTDLNPWLIIIPLFAYCLILILMLNQQIQYLKDLETDHVEFTNQNNSILGFNDILDKANTKINNKIKIQRKIIYWFYVFIVFFVFYAIIAIFGVDRILSFMFDLRLLIELIFLN